MSLTKNLNDDKNTCRLCGTIIKNQSDVITIFMHLFKPPNGIPVLMGVDEATREPMAASQLRKSKNIVSKYARRRNLLQDQIGLY